MAGRAGGKMTERGIIQTNEMRGFAETFYRRIGEEVAVVQSFTGERGIWNGAVLSWGILL